MTKSRIISAFLYTVEKKSSSTVHSWRPFLDDSSRPIDYLADPALKTIDIEACTEEVDELRCSIAVLEIALSEALPEFAYKQFSEALTRKNVELAASTERLRRMYDLQLIHLRARVLDYQRYSKCCFQDHMEQKEVEQRISELRIKISLIFNAKTLL